MPETHDISRHLIVFLCAALSVYAEIFGERGSAALFAVIGVSILLAPAVGAAARRFLAFFGQLGRRAWNYLYLLVKP